VNVNAPLKKCQALVTKVVALIHTTRWKAFAVCGKHNIATPATEADYVTACLGPPQPDTSSAKIATNELKLDKAVQKACILSGVGPLSTVFPGVCASEADADYSACIKRRVACRFCLGVAAADDIMSPLDCDLFDDGTANASCP